MVVRRRRDGEARALAAYVEPRPSAAGLLPRHVLSMTARSLPAYMVPSICYLETLPRLPNFKIDRQRLQALDAVRSSDMTARRSNPALDRIAGAFEAVIGCTGATAEDDLLSLGGDSLQAIEVLMELERRLRRKIPHAVYFGSRNLGELAAALDGAQASP